MTLPDHADAFKRPRRRWLLIPYAVALIGGLCWSLAWLEIGNQVAQAMDRAAVQARSNGLDLTWKARTIGGYPFRIEVTLTGFQVREPSGWGLAAPRAKAIANAYDLEHWVVAAEDGVVLSRPGAGDTQVNGRALRASWVGKGAAAPRVVVEGLDLTFMSDPSARPFPLSSADHAEIFTRMERDGRMDAGLLLAGARPRASSPAAPSLLADMTANRPFALLWQGIVSHPDAFRGSNGPGAAQAWATAGGDITTVRGGMASGPRGLGIAPGSIGLGPDGRLRGQVDFNIRGDASGAVRAIGADHIIEPMAADVIALILQAREAAGLHAQIALTFQAGVTTVGPLAVGPSPKPF